MTYAYKKDKYRQKLKKKIKTAQKQCPGKINIKLSTKNINFLLLFSNGNRIGHYCDTGKQTSTKKWANMQESRRLYENP